MALRDAIGASYFPVYSGALAFVAALVVGSFVLLDQRIDRQATMTEVVHEIDNRELALQSIVRDIAYLRTSPETDSMRDDVLVRVENQARQLLNAPPLPAKIPAGDRKILTKQIDRLAQSTLWLVEGTLNAEIWNDARLAALDEAETTALLAAVHRVRDGVFDEIAAQAGDMKTMLSMLHGGILAGLFAIGAFVFYPLFRKLHDQRQHLIGEARTDPLTGALNRRSFEQAARAEFSRAHRHNGELSLVLLDIDNFKKLNDTFGHAAGDDVIRALAAICSDKIRESDIFARIGGEEFAILLPETGGNEAFIAAEKLRQLLANTQIPVRAADQPVRFTVSFGIASFNRGDADVDDLIHRADMRLYEAKRQGRNRVVAEHVSAGLDNAGLGATNAGGFSGSNLN